MNLKKKFLAVSLALATALSFNVFVETPNSQVKAEEKLNVKNLKDGTYDIDVDIMHAHTAGQKSMADGAVEKSATKLIVENGQYKVRLTFKPLTRDFGGDTFTGYLGNLSYYDADGSVKDCKVVEWYGENDKDDFMDVYTQKYPDRTVYPKVLEYPIDKNKIDDNNNTLETRVKVFVPVMESIGGSGSGMGTQDAKPVFDFSKILGVDRTAPSSDSNDTSSNDQNSGSGDSGSGEVPSVGTGDAGDLGASLSPQEVAYKWTVPTKLWHATENRPSMGNPALVGTTVIEKGGKFYYTVKFQDLIFGKFQDGITRFWVNGNEVPVKKINEPGLRNPVTVSFVLDSKVDKLSVEVFVPTMEALMPGAGRKPAFLIFDWAHATKEEYHGEIPSELAGATQLPSTGLKTTSTALLGAITLLGALYLRRRLNK